MLDLQSVYFGQRNKDFNYQDFDLIKKIQRLARKHQKQCEYSCNGVGYVNGKVYYGGAIDDYAKRQYGANVKSAYMGDEEGSIFDKEAGKIEEKIKSLLGINHLVMPDKDNSFIADKYRVEFQRDPRGATVKLFYDGDYIEL